MSAAGFLEKLLGGAEVAWVPLGDDNFFEIANTARRPVKASLRAPGAIPYYGANNIQDYVEGHTHDGEYVLIAEDGSASLENYSIQYVRGKFWANNHVHVVRGADGVDTRYLFHYLTTANFLPFLSSKGRAKLTKGNLVQMTVPIPCPDDPEKSLAIQGEIVRILDTFTELTAELTAELTLRKKQYNHYRDQLLTFDEGEVEWKTLGNLTRIKTGQSVNKKMIADNPGQFPVINSGREPLGFLDDWNTQDDPIGITSRGAGVGSVTWQEGRYFRGNLNYSVTIRSHDTLDVHYLYHVLEQYQPQIKELCTFDGIPALNAVNLKKLSIPVPSLVEQKRIASILDSFDTLTTSLTEGLPREVELREKQYAYYRDQLLSFSKPDAEAA